MKKRVLVVAAEDFELGPIRRAVSGRRDCEFVFRANGPGPRLAAEAVDGAGSGFDCFVSTGLCGGLSSKLQVGTLVVGTSINGLAIDLPACTGSSVSGPIASVDRVVSTVEERRQLETSGAIAVEMEAAGVLERARRQQRPFYCVKVVSDTASESFHIDLNAARRADGRFAISRILKQSLASPLQAAPELLKLYRNSRSAASVLGEFFANCTF